MKSPVLQIEGLRAGYGRREILRGVSLCVEAGEWFCLLGPNGAGKSTLLHCIATRIESSAGNIAIDGHSLSMQPLAAKEKLGFAASPEQLPGLLTGRQCLEVFAAAKGLAEIDATLLDLASRFGFMKFIDGCVDTYSLGTRQKLCILLALLGEPRLVVLDEAFNGLDPGSALLLKRHLRQRLSTGRCAVLLATHSLDIVEHYADRAALLVDGEIVRDWNRSTLDALRERGGNALEEAVSGVVAEEEPQKTA